MRKVMVWCMTIMLVACAFVGCAAKTEEAITQQESQTSGEQQTGLANPVHQVADLASLLAAVPGVQMADAPAGSTGVTYSYIDGTPTIAQIEFTFEGNAYTYRAAVATKAAQSDISGVYEQLDKTAIYTVPDDEKAGGTFTLKYATGQVYGLSTWFYEMAACQYSLYTATGCDVSQSIVNVTRMLLPLMDAEVTEAAAATIGVAQGVTVVSTGDGELVVNLSNGNTIQFSLAQVGDPGVRAGDVVDIEYSGDLTSVPEAVSVTLVQAALAETQISGKVSMYDATSVFVQVSGGIVYGFVIDNSTQFTGESNALKMENSITVTYTGDLSNAPLATKIHTTAVSSQPERKGTSGSDSGSASLEDKRLAGVVSSLGASYVTITTSTGHSFTFGITGSTVISEYYVLQVGAKIRVTYDGYASDSPNAKKINVIAPYSDDPTPRTYTMEGYTSYYGGGQLVINTASGNVQEFNVNSSTRIVNSEYCISNYPVTVTYYGDEGGWKIATKIVFRTPIVY